MLVDAASLARIVAEVVDLGSDLLVLLQDLLALQAREALEAHVQDRVGLDLGEAEAGR